MKVYGEPHGEASGFDAGEVWHVTFDGRGVADVEDAAIAAALTRAAEHPDSPVHLKAADRDAWAKGADEREADRQAMIMDAHPELATPEVSGA